CAGPFHSAPSSIRQITPAGSVTGKLGLDSQPLWDIQAAPDNSLYFSKLNEVDCLPTSGGSFVIAGYGSGQTAACAVDSSGNLFAAIDSVIEEVPVGGTATNLVGNLYGFCDGDKSIALLEKPLGLATDASANIYAGDSAWVRKIGTNGIVT